MRTSFSVLVAIRKVFYCKHAMALRIPPVLVVLIAAMAAWTISRLVPGFPISVPGQLIVAAVIAATGILVCLLGVLSFRRARTTVNPLHPEQASTLVVAGIYRYTRNPMYLGFALVLLAWVVYLSSWPAVLVVVAFIAYMNQFQIKPEEHALENRFGDGFSQYKTTVRRWL